MTYRSAEVPDLTIIDTPGYISTATSGQSDDMPKNIRDLLVDRCCNENAVIVAVASASGMDVEAQNFWQVLQNPAVMKIDPTRQRVIGVLTHMDCASGKYGDTTGTTAINHLLSNA